MITPEKIHLCVHPSCEFLVNQMFVNFDQEDRFIDIKPHWGRFSNGEANPSFEVGVRNQIVVVVATGYFHKIPVDSIIMDLYLMGVAIKKAGAKKLLAMIPFFPYARQDRKTGPHTTISAAVIPRFLEKVGYEEIIFVDLHSHQIEGMFGIKQPTTHIHAPIYGTCVNYIKQRFPDERSTVIAAADRGGATRASDLVDYFKNAQMVYGDKVRDKETKEPYYRQMVESVEGKAVAVFDDIIDSAGTLTEFVSFLYQHGAVKVGVVATHGVFSGPALERIIAAPPIEWLAVTNTIDARHAIDFLKDHGQNADIIDISALLRETILTCVDGGSISALQPLNNFSQQ